MKSKTFKTIDGMELVVKHRKSAVIFEHPEVQKESDPHDYLFKFDIRTTNELLTYLEIVATEAWSTFTPKEANSMGSDYYEYYDRELDNNGYLSLRECGINVKRPYGESRRLYQFNKAKFQSFIHDFRQMHFVQKG